jgi:hypothetical protein
MSSKTDTFTGVIAKIVRELTRFNVPRLGKISKIDDPEGKARVLVRIPSLNWMTDNVGAWCYPIDKKALVTPEVGSWVIVMWIDGDVNKPVYIGIDSKMKDMLPSAYTDQNSQILFENQGRDFSIRYDESGGVLNIGEGNESFVKGNTLDAWITGTLKAYIDVHVHTGVTAGGASSGPPPVGLTAPSNHLSSKIKGE